MAEMNNSGAKAPEHVSYPENLTHPRDYVAPKVGGSDQTKGATGSIQKQGSGQIFNNEAQGTGIAGPAVWGGASGLAGSQSSAEAGTKQANSNSVDLGTGQNSCWNGGKAYKG